MILCWSIVCKQNIKTHKALQNLEVVAKSFATYKMQKPLPELLHVSGWRFWN